jgi:gamma-glutamyltranspeptidase/glutathione hydrolase
MRKLIAVAVTLFCAAPLGSMQDLGVPSKEGLVVCTSAPACDAGASVMAGGGNAVDAAVATAFALAVTLPSAGNIGGGGFMIVRTPAGEITSFDYRERAPAGSTTTMYLDKDGKIDRALTSSGYLAPGVPGTVRGLEMAHKKFGKLTWQQVIMPAITLAEGGFPMSAGLARGLNSQLAGAMGKFPASVKAYGKPGGGAWAEGDRLVLKDLAKTLRMIAGDGADAFYKGPIADLIAADMKKNNGLITKQDLADYRAKERVPLAGRYKGFDIISLPPVSSGGTALIEMLNIVEPLDLKSKGLLTPPAMHLQIEAMRRGYLDRARYAGDPDFVDVPVAKLTSKEHAREVAKTIDPAKASSSLELGKDIVTVTANEPEETTHFSVIDRSGMAVTSTTTLEGSYGSRVVVEGAGFILNNEMGDFNKKPGETNVRGDIGTAANVIAPGKRMVSNMTPTMVLRDGKVVLLTGSPGGRTITNTVFTIVLGIVEYGLTGREAVDLPRMHHQWLPDEASIETNPRVTAELIAQLKAMGHVVAAGNRQGDAESIWIAPDGTAYGIHDKRTADSKASVPSRLTSTPAGR